MYVKEPFWEWEREILGHNERGRYEEWGREWEKERKREKEKGEMERERMRQGGMEEEVEREGKGGRECKI